VILRLPFGRDAIAADLRGLRCRLLQPSAPRVSPDTAALVAAALDAPAESPPLAELARGRRRIAVLVPDTTRRLPLPAILPVILARLEAAGVPVGDVAVVIACGTHPAVPTDQLNGLLGPLPPAVQVLQHDARDDGSLVAVGTLPSGLAVRLHRAAVEADLLITVSLVAHHYFAGFTGGPKMVFPGAAGYAEIQANHARVIDLSRVPPRRHPGCEPGAIAGNPVAEEIALAAALRPPDLALLLVAGADGRPAWAVAGPLAAAFPRATGRVREWYEVDGGAYRRVIASAGGHPTDHTLIQAHKALDAACRFAAPGAEVLFVAACDGGAGSPDMVPFLADPRPEAIIARLLERYVQYGQTTLRLVEKTARFRVSCVTRLDRVLAERLNLTPVAGVQMVLDRWREEAHGDTVAVLPGPAVFPRVAA
jgi:nickel-dependent lactate racemase